MKSQEHISNKSTQYDDELIQRIESESRLVHSVLRVVDEMALNPPTPIPYGRFMPIFWRWLFRFTAVPIGFAVALCVVAWILKELTPYDAGVVLVTALLLGGSLAAMFSIIVAGTSVLLGGEQLGHDSYLSRVRHDYENAMRLSGFSEKNLKQAATLTKRKIDNITDIRVFFLSFLGGVGTLAIVLLHALEVPNVSHWYGEAARLSALGGLLVTIGYFYSFKPLPRLRYNLSIIELAQQLERDANTEEESARQSNSGLHGRRNSLFKTAVGAVTYWVIHRMHKQ